MCTVTLIARKAGFALGMNRDENLTRVTARPPEIEALDGLKALFPSEPGGGTWIGVNEQGVCCALINWYAIVARAKGQRLSRGRVVTSALSAKTVGELENRLNDLPLSRVNPFRLIAIFAPNKEIVEWRWNLKKLTAVRHGWECHTWISSGYDEFGAQESRGTTFNFARRQASFGRLSWLRSLHCSHRPKRGPYSTCMHRADAATVSYTEIVVSRKSMIMRYQAGAPCKNLKWNIRHLDRTRQI